METASVALSVLTALWVSYTFSASGAPQHKVGEGDTLPENGFRDLAELEAWASGSSFGGGGAARLEVGGVEVFYSDRMFTSGIPTSELVFYHRGADGRLSAFLTAPLQVKEHRVGVEGGRVVVRCYNAKDKTWPVAMEISPWMLPGSTTGAGAGVPPRR